MPFLLPPVHYFPDLFSYTFPQVHCVPVALASLLSLELARSTPTLVFCCLPETLFCRQINPFLHLLQSLFELHLLSQTCPEPFLIPLNMTKCLTLLCPAFLRSLPCFPFSPLNLLSSNMLLYLSVVFLV